MLPCLICVSKNVVHSQPPNKPLIYVTFYCFSDFQLISWKSHFEFANFNTLQTGKSTANERTRKTESKYSNRLE